MTEPASSMLDTRRHQMFPTLASSEVDRLRRFGEVRTYRPGEGLAQVGQRDLGIAIILAGDVEAA